MGSGIDVRNIEQSWRTEGHDAIPMLANLELFAPQGAGPDTFYLGAILRCGEATEASDDARVQFRVRLRRGFLEVKYNGCAALNGSHQHDWHASERRSTERLTSREETSNRSTLEFEAGGGVGSSKLAAKLQKRIGRLDQPDRMALQRQIVEHVDIYSVRYRGNEGGKDVWQIGGGSGTEAEFLNWKYLGDDHLCEITITSMTDFHVIATFYFYQVDMDIADLSLDGRPLSKSGD